MHRYFYQINFNTIFKAFQNLRYKHFTKIELCSSFANALFFYVRSTKIEVLPDNSVILTSMKQCHCDHYHKVVILILILHL